MNIKTLQVRLTRDRFNEPLAIVVNMPGEGMDASPAQLRRLGEALILAAADCEARNTKGKIFSETMGEYSLDLSNEMTERRPLTFEDPIERTAIRKYQTPIRRADPSELQPDPFELQHDMLFEVCAEGGVDDGKSARLRLDLREQQAGDLALEILLKIKYLRLEDTKLPEIALFGRLTQQADKREFAFEIQGGHTVVEGKSHWPDLVRLSIPKTLAHPIVNDLLHGAAHFGDSTTLRLVIRLFGHLTLLRGD